MHSVTAIRKIETNICCLKFEKYVHFWIDSVISTQLFEKLIKQSVIVVSVMQWVLGNFNSIGVAPLGSLVLCQRHVL